MRILGPRPSSPSKKNWQFSLDDCLAKTYRKNGETLPGRRVLDHCYIVGMVARKLIERLPEKLRQTFFPPGSELIAAAHDIGKVSPLFQEKIYRHADKNYIHNSRWGINSVEPEQEKQWGGHAGVSLLASESMGVSPVIAEILGKHHGKKPNLSSMSINHECLGDTFWQERRIELVEKLKKQLCCNWPEVNNSTQAMILAGLTTVSDWIGSGDPFEEPIAIDIENLSEKALDEAGFIYPKIQKNLNFESIFGFKPNKTQQDFIQL